jgi:hypothetical protein
MWKDMEECTTTWLKILSRYSPRDTVEIPEKTSLFYPEDKDSTFLRNADTYLTDYILSNPIKN